MLQELFAVGDRFQGRAACGDVCGNGGGEGAAAFGTADGMESSETNGENQPAGWKARDGRLWIPIIKGVVLPPRSPGRRL